MLQRTLIFAATLFIHAAFTAVNSAITHPIELTQTVLPITGLCLGLYLLYGTPVLIASFLGYWLITFNPNEGIPTLLALIYAIASCIQMPVARYLLNKAFASTQNVNITKKVLLVMFWAGPIACLISTLPASTLSSFLNNLIFEEAYQAWVTWWVRDSISILYFTPIVLFLKPNRYLISPIRVWRMILIGVSLYCLTVGVFTLSQSKFKTEQEQAFYRVTQPYMQQLTVAQNTILNYLKAMKGFYLGSNYVNREEFRIFTTLFYKGDIKLRAIAWMPHVEYSQREYFKQLAIKDGITEFEFREVTDQGVVTSPKRPFYYPIYYSEPIDKNRAALGIDVSNHPVVTNTVNRSIKTDTPSITPLFSLAQQQDKFTGVIIYYPVYRLNQSDLRTHPPLGLLEVVLELDILLEGINEKVGNESYALKFTYGDGNEITLGDFNPSARLIHGFKKTFFNQTARIEFSSLPSYESQFVDWISWIAHIFGFLAGLLVCVFIYTISNFNDMLEREVQFKTKEISTKNKELESANKSQSTFLANMSHEIRTPLNGIMGVFQILEKFNLEEHIKRHIKNGKSSSSILLTLLNDILDFSKIESGKIELDITEVNVPEVFTHVVSEFSTWADEKSISIKLHYSDTMHTTWQSDSLRLRQILSNLISNSIKFTKEGTINVLLEENTEGIKFEVIDSGIGMSQPELKKLFSRFEQADKSTTRKYGGTGLGMAITKQLVDLMQGQIWVKSQINQGTTFQIVIPLEKVEKPQPLEAQAAIEIPNLADKTLLIVEDNLINQQILESMLEDTQAKIIIVENGQEAVNCCEKEQLDMIFMDIQMPVMDGVTACRIIRETHADLPILSVSANTYNDDIKLYMETGFSGHIPKPIDSDLLFKEISRLLS